MPRSTPDGSNRSRFPLSFRPAQKSLSAAAESVADVGSRAVGASTRAIYTVPSNSTLMEGRAMTALIRARADRWNRQQSRTRSKVLIGPDNPRPTASTSRRGRRRGQRHGLGRLDALVRARANPLGHVRVPGRHHPHGAGGSSWGSSSGGNSRPQRANIQGGLGWISDPTAFPGRRRRRRSNANSTWAARRSSPRPAPALRRSSIRQRQRGRGRQQRHSSLGTVGISGNEAMGRILAGGVRDMADWVNKLYGQAFAAVYVQPAPGGRASGATARHRLRRQGGVGSITAPEKPMPRIWIDAAAVLLAATLLGGCALPARRSCCHHGDNTMLDIWHQETGGSAGGDQAARQLLDARQGLRRPLTGPPMCRRARHGARTRVPRRHEIYRQFQRLPNPDLVMYVFPTWRAPTQCRCPATARCFRSTSACGTRCRAKRVED